MQVSEQEEALTPREIVEKASLIGASKAVKSMSAQIIKGLLAGAYLAFATAAAEIAGASGALGETGVAAPILKGLMLSFGPVFVILFGADLFTKNLLVGVVAKIDNIIDTDVMLKNLLVLFISNFLGALLIAGLVFLSGIWKADGADIGDIFVRSAALKCSIHPLEAFFRGIGGGWLLSLAFWGAIAAASVSGKVVSTIMPMIIFSLLRFEHGVSNMFSVPMGLILQRTELGIGAPHALSELNFLLNGLLPVVAGNIFGAAFFVGALYSWVYLRHSKL